MITLKEALTLTSDDIKKLKDDLTSKIKQNKIGAYVEQLISTELSQSGALRKMDQAYAALMDAVHDG